MSTASTKQAALAALVALSLAGCAPDATPTAPDFSSPSLAVTCPDDFCGPTDGTIHDGTGIGSVPIVAGDPSPGAAGIWLGNKVSARWCYASHNVYVTDTDYDWLDDECEYQLAKAFAPVFAVSPSDRCPGGEPYWAAKYFDQGFGGWGQFVRIAYMPAYYRDCGKSPHAGDSEFIMVSVHENTATRHWEVRDAYYSAHAGTPNDASDYIRLSSDLEYPTRHRAYPRVWTARNKHGNYRTRNECNTRAAIDDNCSDNVNRGRLRIHRSRNVGSRFVDRFPSGAPSQNPLYSGNGRREYFYRSVNFAGWQINAAGVTPYRTSLGFYVFECFDYTYTFTGTCYWGPGRSDGSRPSASATTMTGVIDGPTSVTPYQTYTWTTFVTGGVVPYRAEWWRRYASASVATLMATTTGSYNGVTSTAGSWSATVDRCENFTISVRFWSADNRTWVDHHDVGIASCPPPPLSVRISGPGAITVKGTYAFTALLTNFSGPSYTWSERFCNDWGGTSCTSWVTITGIGTTFNRTLGPKCGTLRQDNFQLRVVVRNSDGRTATDTHMAQLCESAL